MDYLTNEEELTSIADAIREKTGSNGLITYPTGFVSEIESIETGGGLEEGDLTFNVNDMSSKFSNNFLANILNKYSSLLDITTKQAQNMFKSSDSLTTLEGATINVSGLSTSSGCDIRSMFYNCKNLLKFPTITGIIQPNFQTMFYGCENIKDSSQFALCLGDEDLSTKGNNGYAMMFQNCYSLRGNMSEINNVLQTIYDSSTYSSAGNDYASMYASCYCLDEIIDIPVCNQTLLQTGELFGGMVSGCYRISEVQFKKNGTNPYTATWKNMIIDLSGEIGYTATNQSLITSHGIPLSKGVQNATQYEALKNDPDWFAYGSATGLSFSRYNHNSAINTINSLPSTWTTGTNTIKFKRNMGSATDGGAVGELTASEIAVATDKGWTVSLV